MIEFHISRIFEFEFVRGCLATILSLAPDQIEIGSYESLPRTRQAMMIVTQRGGDFPLQLSVYPALPAPPPEAAWDEFAIAKSLAQILSCKILVPDDSSNPYRWLQVDSNGNVLPVFVDAEALDEWDEFRLLGTDPSGHRRESIK